MAPAWLYTTKSFGNQEGVAVKNMVSWLYLASAKQAERGEILEPARPMTSVCRCIRGLGREVPAFLSTILAWCEMPLGDLGNACEPHRSPSYL